MVAIHAILLNQLLFGLECLITLGTCGLLDLFTKVDGGGGVGGGVGGGTQFLVGVDKQPALVQDQSLVCLEVRFTGGAGGLTDLFGVSVCCFHSRACHNKCGGGNFFIF
jgi:hypothetical protein